MKDKLNLCFIVFIITVALAACAKPPVEDMENAQAAVLRAQSDPEVAIYAPSGLARARESLANMAAESEAKRYDEAKRLAGETIALAEKAIQDARNAVIRARDEAAQAITLMENVITETSETIENARRSRQNVDFNEIDSDFNNARTGADAARNANSEKRYREVIDTSSSVRAQLGNITAKIGQASIAASRKK